MKDQKLFTWDKTYKTKSLKFAHQIPFIRQLILNNVNKKALKKVYLFGSYAYGRPHKQSDVDLCIVIGDKYNVDDYYDSVGRAFVENKITSFDLLIYNEEYFNDPYNEKGLEATIAKKGILLYG